MKLSDGKKEITLYECKSFYTRFMGFMGKRNINNAILFNKCNSIHTFFMKEKIDVIMCDSDNKVLYYYKNLDKNRVILPKKAVKKVFETQCNYFDVEIGKKMIINED